MCFNVPKRAKESKSEKMEGLRLVVSFDPMSSAKLDRCAKERYGTIQGYRQKFVTAATLKEIGDMMIEEERRFEKVVVKSE